MRVKSSTVAKKMKVKMEGDIYKSLISIVSSRFDFCFNVLSDYVYAGPSFQTCSTRGELLLVSFSASIIGVLTCIVTLTFMVHYHACWKKVYER